ncbi:MAG: hypothetical protein ACI4S2_09525 [Lachnospiraceae bacterium]
MSIKEYGKSMLQDFFVITTFVNIVMFVLGSIYRPEVTFSYEILLFPPLYGFLGTIPSWILYSKKELSTRQIVIRKILQVIVLELILILVIFGGENLCKENIPVITALAISVFLVYVLVNIVSWLLDVRTAKAVMKELSEYQKKDIAGNS